MFFPKPDKRKDNLIFLRKEMKKTNINKGCSNRNHRKSGRGEVQSPSVAISPFCLASFRSLFFFLAESVINWSSVFFCLEPLRVEVKNFGRPKLNVKVDFKVLRTRILPTLHYFDARASEPMRNTKKGLFRSSSKP